MRKSFEAQVVRDRYAELYDQAPIGYLTLTATGHVADLNLPAAVVLGRTRGIVLNRPFALYVQSYHLDRFLDHLRRCRASRSRTVTELDLTRPQGGSVHVQLASGPELSHLDARFYHSALTDLTDQQAMEQSLREKESRLRAGLRGAHAGYWEFELATGAAIWSEEFSELLGLDPQRTSASVEVWLRCIHPKDRSAAHRLLTEVEGDRHPTFYAEFRIADRPRVQWIAMQGQLRAGGAGSGPRLAGIGMDITLRKQAEESLRRARHLLEARVRERTVALQTANSELWSQIAERRRLEKEVLEISEREQRRIGRDLHDGLGQQITGMIFLNNVLHEKLARKGIPEAAEAARLAELLDQARAQTRQLARGLHPVAPQPSGLMNALAALAEHTSILQRIPCTFACPDPVLLPDNEAATHLFRIAQEAVTNAVRHSGGTHVRVSLTRTNGVVTLQIEDNGRGWRKAPKKGLGLGWRIMKYRSQAIGGTVVNGCAVPRGTVIRCQLPVAQPNP